MLANLCSCPPADRLNTMTHLLGTGRAGLAFTGVEGGVASRPQRLERPGRQLLRSGLTGLLSSRGSRCPLSQAAANAVRFLPGKHRSRAAEGVVADRAAETVPDQAGSAVAGAGSGACAGQGGSAEAAGTGAAARGQPAQEYATAEAGTQAPAIGAAGAQQHSPWPASAEAGLQAEVTWPGFRLTGTRAEGRTAAGAADVMDASPIPGPDTVLPSLEAHEHETMAASKRLLWATALQTRRERIRAAAAAQQLARRQAGNTQQGAGLEGLQAVDMPQAGWRLADRRDAADHERSGAAPKAGQTLSAGPQTSSRVCSAVPEADVSAGTSPQTSIPERSGADEAGGAQGVTWERSGAEAGWPLGSSWGRSAALPDSGRSQGVRKPASSRGHSAAPLERSWSQMGRLRASTCGRGHSAAPRADLSQGEMASIVESLGANANVLASSPLASPWQSGQGLQVLTQADLEASRHEPGQAGQPDDQEADSAGLPHSGPAAASLAAAAAAAAGRAAGREADIPASLQDLDWFEPFVARQSKVSSEFAAASQAGQQGNAVILDSVEPFPPANTEAAAQAAAEGSPGMSDTTEAASEALSDPDATQPTSPPQPHSQALRSTAQSGGSQAVPETTTSGPWGSFGTTGPSHTEKSAAQEKADGTTATSKVRSRLVHMHLSGDLCVGVRYGARLHDTAVCAASCGMVCQ